MGRKADFKNKIRKGGKSSKRKIDFERFITDEHSSQTRDKSNESKKRKLHPEPQNEDFEIEPRLKKQKRNIKTKKPKSESQSDDEIPQLVDPETFKKNASNKKTLHKRKTIQLFEKQSEDEEEEMKDDDPEQARLKGLNKMIEDMNEESSENEEEETTQDPDQDEDDSEQVELFPEEEEGIKIVPDFNLAYMRINGIIAALANFKKFRKEGKSRADYIARLTKDLCTYFAYNEYLMEKLMDLFNPSQLLNFLEANEKKDKTETIRVNSLKTNRRNLAQALSERGFKIDKLDYCPVGMVVYNSARELGSTTEYLAGHYMKQGGGSWFPVMALAPQENEVILDMCAAPGGKTTHIGQVMRNTGVLVANDYREDRIKAVVGNLHRMGIANAVVCVKDGRDFPGALSLSFDRVLLDAPCSGTGVISKEPQVKENKSYEEIKNLAHLQKQLILSAIDSLKVKGTLVYSTCSVLVEENEDVVQYALNKRRVKIVPTGLTVGCDGFTRLSKKRYHPTMQNTKRFYPHIHNVEGFFVAKLIKLETPKPATKENGEATPNPQASKKAQQDEEEAEDNEAAENLQKSQKSEDDDEESEIMTTKEESEAIDESLSQNELEKEEESNETSPPKSKKPSQGSAKKMNKKKGSINSAKKTSKSPKVNTQMAKVGLLQKLKKIQQNDLEVGSSSEVALTSPLQQHKPKLLKKKKVINKKTAQD